METNCIFPFADVMFATRIVEARSASDFQANRTFNDLDLTNDLVSVRELGASVLVDRHKVDQFHNRIPGKITREQNVSVGKVQLLQTHVFELWLKSEEATFILIQQRCEHARRITVGEAAEVDRYF